jgi:hypothetical protein
MGAKASCAQVMSDQVMSDKVTKRSDIKEIARPENGTSRIQSVSINFDMFVQC